MTNVNVSQRMNASTLCARLIKPNLFHLAALEALEALFSGGFIPFAP